MLRRFLLLVGMSLSSGVIFAASIGTESFTTNAANWTLTSLNGAGVVHMTDASNGWIQVNIPPLPFPVPNLGAILSAGSSASSGRFSGDYDAVDGRVLAFSFRAEGGLPSELELRFSGTNQTYGIELSSYVTNLGETVNFTVSLASAGAGPWGQGMASQFEPTLLNVTNLRIRVISSGTLAQTYRVDQVGLTRLPRVVDLLHDGTHIHLMLNGLEQGRSYRVLRQDSPLTEWVDLGGFLATNIVDTVQIGPETGVEQADYAIRFPD